MVRSDGSGPASGAMAIVGKRRYGLVFGEKVDSDKAEAVIGTVTELFPDVRTVTGGYLPNGDPR